MSFANPDFYYSWQFVSENFLFFSTTLVVGMLP